MPFLDPTLSPRRRAKSFALFASGGWRSAIFREVARRALLAGDVVLANRATTRAEQISR